MAPVLFPAPPRPAFGRGGWGVRACPASTEAPWSSQRESAIVMKTCGRDRSLPNGTSHVAARQPMIAPFAAVWAAGRALTSEQAVVDTLKQEENARR
jgi:hypothetical protein